MFIRRLALLMVLIYSMATAAETPSIPQEVSSLVELGPNPRLFRSTPPTDKESEKFYRLAGLSRHQVILAVGHPSDVIPLSDASEVWLYVWDIDWPANVVFRNGRVCDAGFGRQSGVVSSPYLIVEE
jgi:hypothetical protein